MVKSTQFYSEKSDNGMVLRNGKIINCLSSTRLFNLLNIIVSDTYYVPKKYQLIKKKNCCMDCRMLNNFLYILQKFGNDITNHPRLNRIYNLCKDKTKQFIDELEEDAIKHNCSCGELYLNEFKRLYPFYNQPTKYQKALYFYFASRMNRDVAGKIIDYL